MWFTGSDWCVELFSVHVELSDTNSNRLPLNLQEQLQAINITHELPEPLVQGIPGPDQSASASLEIDQGFAVGISLEQARQRCVNFQAQA